MLTVRFCPIPVINQLSCLWVNVVLMMWSVCNHYARGEMLECLVLTARCHSTQSGVYPRYAELPIDSLTHTPDVATWCQKWDLTARRY